MTCKLAREEPSLIFDEAEAALAVAAGADPALDEDVDGRSPPAGGRL